ncbi:hypothetical protein LG71_08000 [Pluralibacter gergoviae]|nr:hypothetical protein LG71_08000 [Pluralibacter gergoviae]
MQKQTPLLSPETVLVNSEILQLQDGIDDLLYKLPDYIYPKQSESLLKFHQQHAQELQLK